jgi:hypothetical protein
VLSEAIAAPRGSFATNPRYRAVRAALPDAPRDLAAIDMVAVRRVAQAYAEQSGLTAQWRPVEPFLRPIAALGSATAPVNADGLVRAQSVVVFDLAALGAPPSLDPAPPAMARAASQVVAQMQATVTEVLGAVGQAQWLAHHEAWLARPPEALAAWAADQPVWGELVHRLRSCSTLATCLAQP